jgi:hypothetical protein
MVQLVCDCKASDKSCNKALPPAPVEIAQGLLNYKNDFLVTAAVGQIMGDGLDKFNDILKL